MNSTGFRLVVAYAAALAGSLWLAYQLRFDFAVPETTRMTYPLVFAWVLGFKLLCLWRFRQFDVLPGFFSLSDCSRLMWILLAVAVVVFEMSPRQGWTYAPPRSVVLIDFSVSLVALAGIRLGMRKLHTSAANPTPGPPRPRPRRAGIVGAGLVGTALAQEFSARRDLGLQAVAFFDDDRLKWGKCVMNVPVVGAVESLRNGHADLELEEVIIAMPGAPAKRVAEIVDTLQQLKIKFRTVPSTYELTTGQARVSQLRSVDAQELLGREQIRLATGDIRKLVRDRVVMVTGAGGSIGAELCRQIASHAPQLLLLVEQSEVQLFQIEQELIESGHGRLIVPLVANVQDAARLDSIVRRHQPACVFHAAAHKHVPMMESQPGEAVKNNALGTLRLAEICVKHGIDRFVLISSDKAINPTNVMGATKRLAEMCVQSLYESNPGATRFMAVRFGNVLGSSGSVVPIFNKQIAAGGPVTVTHPDVTRYFMTIPEAVGLVLQAATMGFGGEIFTLDMGQPVKIVDLARQLIEIAGFVPDKDIRIEFTGLRPGEKLFEELSYQGEHVAPTRHPKIMQMLCEPLPFDRVRGCLLELAAQIDSRSPEDLKRLLQLAVPEYRPQFGSLKPGQARNGEPSSGMPDGQPSGGQRSPSGAALAPSARGAAGMPATCRITL